MDVKMCDRCGRIVKKETAGISVRKEWNDGGTYTRYFEFCDQCDEDATRFMAGLEIKELKKVKGERK